MPDRSSTRGSSAQPRDQLAVPDVERDARARRRAASSTWVNPPVLAPTSRHRRPATAGRPPVGQVVAGASRSLAAPRPTSPVLGAGLHRRAPRLGVTGWAGLRSRPAVDQDPAGPDQLAGLAARPGQATANQLGVDPRHQAHAPESASRSCSARWVPT